MKELDQTPTLAERLLFTGKRASTYAEGLLMGEAADTIIRLTAVMKAAERWTHGFFTEEGCECDGCQLARAVDAARKRTEEVTEES